MNTALETAIVERLHRLDEPRQAQILDFVEYLATIYHEYHIEY